MVDNLLFFGCDADDAERKLRQIYVGCEILEMKRIGEVVRRELLPNYEDIVDLLADQDAPRAAGVQDGACGRRV